MPIFFIVLSLSAVASFATVTVEGLDCPQQFEGRVQESLDQVGPSSALATHTVVFKNQRTLKGEVKQQVYLELLKHGPLQVELGEDYRVQMRDGRLCWIEKI